MTTRSEHPGLRSLEAKVRAAQAALDQARAQAREIEAEALAQRDKTVGEALAVEITPYRISKWTGLSHTAVANIQKRLRAQQPSTGEGNRDARS